MIWYPKHIYAQHVCGYSMMVIRCSYFKSKQISFHFLIYFYQEWVNWVTYNTKNRILNDTLILTSLCLWMNLLRRTKNFHEKKRTRKNNDKKCYSNTFRIFNAEDNTLRWMTRLFQLTQSQHVLYLHLKLSYLLWIKFDFFASKLFGWLIS